jgi:adenylate cyclase
MPHEIEHKYLIDLGRWRPQAEGVSYRQGYLTADKACVVRVRIAGGEAFVTIKGPSEGLKRLEFEYPIPLEDAEVMLENLAQGALIEKTRHKEDHAGRAWEIDVFHGDNEGLVVAEVEVEHADDAVTLPDWIVTEVSHDPRYFNNNLVANPYRNWRDEA